MRVAFIRHFAAVYQGYNGTEKMYFVWILTLLIINYFYPPTMEESVSEFYRLSG